MTRALTECILDPFITIYNLLVNYKWQDNFWIFFAINAFSLVIITFCSLVYNDFLVLYCYGLEKDTHLEISKRSAVNGNSISEHMSDEKNEEEEEEDDDDDDED